MKLHIPIPRRGPCLVPALVSLVAVGALLACHHEASSTQLTSGASSAAQTPKAAPITDIDIVQALQRHLKEDASLSTDHVQATSVNGICTLDGKVGSLLAKERAVRIAETLRGVRSVIDRIDVQPVARTDAQLKTDVTHALQHDSVTRKDSLEVAAKEGRITITGSASSWPDKQLVAQVAKGVPGVKSIENDVVVKYPSAPSESQISADVKHRIQNDVWLEGNPITVTVTGHVVHLKGTVGSVAEKTRARSDSWLGGVDDVDDGGLGVDWAARDDQRHVIAGALRSDDDTAQAVRDAFKLDPRIATVVPKVAVHGGLVELTGALESARARRAAELDARDTVGVADVHDLTTVEPPGKPTDADIDRAVMRALGDDLLLGDAKDIKESTSKGKVTLQGNLKSGFERFDAIEDVAGVPGVSEIVDDLGVTRSPADIKAAIDDRLYWDATVERDRVKVAVAPDGVATLTGNVDSGSEVRAAVVDATMGGAKRVIDLVKVKTK